MKRPDFMGQRRGPILLLIGLVAGVALLQRFGGSAPDDGPLRFVMQTEPHKLPPVDFVDASGSRTNLAAMRGKVVLLNIWATWCPPCRKEMPSLDRLQGRMSGTGFEVVALSIDKGAGGLPAVKDFYAALGLRSLRVYNDPDGEAGFQIGAPGVPTTLLLDREGREIGRVSGAAEWDGPEAIALIRRSLVLQSP